MKKISVIIACHNVTSYLDRCWNSLKNQTIGLDNIECIFVDDASTDNGATWQKLAQIEQEAPDSVMVIHLEQNMRQGGARNVALNYASGKYVQFVDADDELVLEACELLYNIAETHQVDIIQFNKCSILGDIRKSIGECNQTGLYEINSVEARKPLLLTNILTCGCLNKFYKMSMVRESQAKYAEHVVYEEPLFVYPQFFYANRIYLTEEMLYNYYLHEGSTMSSEIGKRIMEHPMVQFQVLEYCLERKDLYELYKNEIEIYFLWTFYCETLCFAGGLPDAVIPLEFYKEMQKICRQYFPDWRNNPYIATLDKNVVDTLAGIDEEIESQQQLNIYMREVATKL